MADMDSAPAIPIGLVEYLREIFPVDTPINFPTDVDSLIRTGTAVSIRSGETNVIAHIEQVLNHQRQGAEEDVTSETQGESTDPRRARTEPRS